jgi:hypothetical protein
VLQLFLKLVTKASLDCVRPPRERNGTGGLGAIARPVKEDGSLLSFDELFFIWSDPKRRLAFHLLIDQRAKSSN